MAFLAGALLLTASGQIAFNLGVTTRRRLVIVIGLSELGFAMICTFLALRTLGIGFVYLSTGLTHVLVLLGSKFILKEEIPNDRWWGAAIIAAGVWLYAASV